MELFVAVVSGLIAALVLWWINSSKLPSGPWGLPILGYLPFLTSKPYIALMKLAKQYGNIFSIRLGSIDMVILNDFDSTKEAFLQDALIARPVDDMFELNKETIETGAFFGVGWKEHRRHCLHLLRDLGFGKTKMEEHIQEEIDELLDYFERNVGKPFCLRPLMTSSMSNNIASIVFGKRMKYDDPMRQRLTKIIRDASETGLQVAWLIFFPRLRQFMKFLGIGPLQKFNQANQLLKDYVLNEINEHEETFKPDNIRDFIDGYLLEMQKRKNDPTFTKAMLHDLVGALFGAGSETVRASVEWLMLGVASDQKAQQRIYEEISNTIGERPPIWTDLKEMPYTNAFMSEMQRWRTLIPLNLLRYSVTDTTVGGVHIPKHTRIMSNHWAIHHDPGYWGADADEFRPERFLTEDGKEMKKLEHFVPFSTGKRSCPGEPLARVEIFLYFVSFVQRFQVKMPGDKKADFEGVLGLGLNPKPQDVILTKRN